MKNNKIETTVKELESLANNLISTLDLNPNDISHLMEGYYSLMETRKAIEEEEAKFVAPMKKIRETFKPLYTIFNEPLEQIRLKLELLEPESSAVFNWQEKIDYEIVDENKIPEQFFDRVLNKKKLDKTIKAGVDIEGVKRNPQPKTLIIKTANYKK